MLFALQPGIALFTAWPHRGPHFSGRCKTSERVLSGETQTRLPQRRLSLILYCIVFVTKNSAGTLSYLKTSAWNKLRASLSDEDGLPLDMSEAFLSAVESLMLAQAQECVWQWAVMGMITGWVSYQTIMTSKSRSWFKRDHSKVGSSGQSPYLLCCSLFTDSSGLYSLRQCPIGNSQCRHTHLVCVAIGA